MVDVPYAGAPVRIDSIYAYPGLIGATRLASGGLRGPGGWLPASPVAAPRQPWLISISIVPQ